MPPIHLTCIVDTETNPCETGGGCRQACRWALGAQLLQSRNPQAQATDMCGGCTNLEPAYCADMFVHYRYMHQAPSLTSTCAVDHLCQPPKRWAFLGQLCPQHPLRDINVSKTCTRDNNVSATRTWDINVSEQGLGTKMSRSSGLGTKMSQEGGLRQSCPKRGVWDKKCHFHRVRINHRVTSFNCWGYLHR
jgi:hypothetical protein